MHPDSKLWKTGQPAEVKHARRLLCQSSTDRKFAPISSDLRLHQNYYEYPCMWHFSSLHPRTTDPLERARFFVYSARQYPLFHLSLILVAFALAGYELTVSPHGFKPPCSCHSSTGCSPPKSTTTRART